MSAYSAEPQVIELSGTITDVLALEFQTKVNSQLPTKQIEVLIDSRGGDAEVGLSLAKAIEDAQKNGIVFKCVAKEAASAAFMIWSACQIKQALAYSTIVFHYPYSVYGRRPMRVKDLAAELPGSMAIEQAYKKQWESVLLPFVAADKIEEAAVNETPFSGVSFCTKFTTKFCEVIYKYEYLDNK